MLRIICVLVVLGVIWPAYGQNYNGSNAYTTLQHDYGRLKGSYRYLEDDYTSLQGDYSMLREDYDSLLRKYDTVQETYSLLQWQYGKLLKERKTRDAAKSSTLYGDK